MNRPLGRVFAAAAYVADYQQRLSFLLADENEVVSFFGDAVSSESR